MDPILKSKKSKKKQQFHDKFFIYTFIAFGCCMLCFFFIYDLLNLLFIAGNLIVAVLIGESKFFASGSSFSGDTNTYYEEYIDRSRHRRIRNCSTSEFRKENIMKPVEEQAKKGCLREEHELVLPKEELKRRADDFIARVNRQRRSEARLVL